MAEISSYPILSSDLDNLIKVLCTDTGDQSEAFTGTTKVILGSDIVSTDGNVAKVSGGGEIALGGYTVTFTGDGTLDLNNGTLTLISGGTINFNNKTLTLDSDVRFDLEGKTIGLNAAKDNLTIDGVTLPEYDPNGTIDLGGSALTFSGGTLTIGSSSVDMDSAAEWAGSAAPNGELVATDANGKLVRSKLVRTGSGVLTLAGADWNQTLTVSSGGAIDFSGKTLTLSGNSITVGSNTIDMSKAIEGSPGATSELAMWNASGDVVASKVYRGAGSGKFTLANAASDVTLDVDESMSVVGGGTINLKGFEFSFDSSGALHLNGERITVYSGSLFFHVVGDPDIYIDSSIELDGNGNALTLDSDTTLSGEGNRLTLRSGNIMLEGGGTIKTDGGAFVVTAGNLDLNGYTVSAAKSGTIAMTDDIQFNEIVSFGVAYRTSGSGTAKKYFNSILFDPADYPAGASFKIELASKKLVAGSATFRLYSGPLDTQTGATTLGESTVSYEATGAIWSGSFNFTPPTEKRLFIIEAQGSDNNTYELSAFQMVVTK